MKNVPDFILEIDNFFSIEESMKYIDYFDNMEMGGFTVDRIRDRGTRPHDVSALGLARFSLDNNQLVTCPIPASSHHKRQSFNLSIPIL